MPLNMSLKKTAKKYAEMMNDGELLSNRNALKVIDARILQLMDRIDVEDAPDRMKNLYGLWQELQEADRRGKKNDVVVLTVQINAEFEKAYHDYKAWEQAMEVFDLRRKMVDSEVKVIKDMKAILTAEQARNLVVKLLAVCIREVKDPRVLKRINYAFSRIIGEDKMEPVEMIDAEVEEE